MPSSKFNCDTYNSKGDESSTDESNIEDTSANLSDLLKIFRRKKRRKISESDSELDSEFDDPILEKEETKKVLPNQAQGKVNRKISISGSDIENFTNIENEPEDHYQSHFKSCEEEINSQIIGNWNEKIVNDSILGQSQFFSIEKAAHPLVFSASGKDLSYYRVKSKVATAWLKHNEVKADLNLPFSPFQEAIFSRMNSYCDVLYCDRTLENCQDIRKLIALHSVNHVLKTRDIVMKNNEKLSKNSEREYRDQGFTRPKVLILVPFKNSAYDIIELIIKLSGCEHIVNNLGINFDKLLKVVIQENKKRFNDEYAPVDDIDSMMKRKPDDFKATFHGNIDDSFKIALKITRKNIKLYSDFYSSDIIISSPLGLRMVIGSNGDKKRDYDFLSSIEVLAMDQTHQFLMQNWDHVKHILDHLNLIPKEDRGCDFSRIRNWYLEERAKYFRQTLIFTDFLTPEINSMFNSLENLTGKWKFKPNYKGSLLNTLIKVPQTFSRIECSTPTESIDSRFAYFTDKVIPNILKSAKTSNHTLIFISSYFDYLRVRNYMKEMNLSFEACSEYTPVSKLQKKRSKFLKGEVDFLIITERFHFFRRFLIRGVLQILFYDLPHHPSFYPDIVNFLRVGGMEEEKSVSVIYSHFDALRLERVVGTKNCRKMLRPGKGVFLFA